MNNIPTAESFLNNRQKELGYNPCVDFKRTQETLIEFAKLHVKAALIAAQKRHRETQTYEPEHRDIVNSAILNAYPLTNIR
jgi:hypothetical protein